MKIEADTNSGGRGGTTLAWPHGDAIEDLSPERVARAIARGRRERALVAQRIAARVLGALTRPLVGAARGLAAALAGSARRDRARRALRRLQVLPAHGIGVPRGHTRRLVADLLSRPEPPAAPRAPRVAGRAEACDRRLAA
jgi:hypothetical protein